MDEDILFYGHREQSGGSKAISRRKLCAMAEPSSFIGGTYSSQSAIILAEDDYFEKGVEICVRSYSV